MDLVVQGAEVDTPDLKAIARLIGARAIEQIAAGAFRLRGGTESVALAQFCDARRLDFAWVPEGRRLAQFGLLVTDMDSTLITIECIDELADLAGVKPEVAAITGRAMRGEIDFAQSLAARVALLAGLDESALARVYDERLELSPGVERLLAGLRAAGVPAVLVSGGFTYFTERLRSRLGFAAAHANVLEIAEHRLTGRVLGEIVDGEVKRRVLLEHRARLGVAPGDVLAIGDGANDLPMLREAGFGVAYRAKPVVRAAAGCALNFVGLDGLLNLFA